ncbi:hypothetical protein [Mycolicibacterium sphagni]|uniref:hypothetical protein n=1 Tax=Mycolicibacterium sphagni TaxID=1786 RepID=UPI0021F2681B|nr:hypothetical protein [Mycolicibacterium sphagni]MCV7174807.1 hypothetical protein [Mycolicibacterium sphagni]
MIELVNARVAAADVEVGMFILLRREEIVDRVTAVCPNAHGELCEITFLHDTTPRFCTPTTLLTQIIPAEVPDE